LTDSVPDMCVDHFWL